MKNYTIFFLGEAIEPLNITDLKINLQKLFKAKEASIDKLFTGKPVAIKKNLPEDKALSYEKALIKSGAKVILKEVDSDGNILEEAKQDLSANQTIQVSEPSKINSALNSLTNYNSPVDNHTQRNENNIHDDEILSMLPANTGNLEEFIHRESPVKIPDLSHLIAEQADLQSFAKEKKAIHIPDISAIHLDNNETYHAPIENVPVKKAYNTDVVDTIILEKANTGSLEDCIQEKEAKVLPDISHLTTVNP